jgi:dTDP-4-amino-4,6-dideoxygalactose transaminase
MSPRTEEPEARLAQFTGARHALAVANCTVGLHLMCLAADLGPGDEVIVPSLTFVASANAIRYTGATPVFAEIEGLDAPWLSTEAVEAALTDRTKAIMTVAYGGNPGAAAELETLARQRGFVLLEDAAHAAGTRLDGRHAGTFGSSGGFSFFSNKNLAVGEGGAVVTDDDDVAARMRLLRSHGMTSLSWDRHRGHATRYDVVELGFNYRIDEPRAAPRDAPPRATRGGERAAGPTRRAVSRRACRSARGGVRATGEAAGRGARASPVRRGAR